MKKILIAITLVGIMLAAETPDSINTEKVTVEKAKSGVLITFSGDTTWSNFFSVSDIDFKNTGDSISIEKEVIHVLVPLKKKDVWRELVINKKTGLFFKSGDYKPPLK
jgi:hypothetical protein